MRILVVSYACNFGARQAAAQGGQEQTLFLLLPVGARAIGMGQTAVASRDGSEGIWWNPASIAGDTLKEIALHHSQTIIGQGNALSFVYPTRHFGSIAASANVLDLDEQESTDANGNRLGVFLPTAVAFALTYAAAPSPLFSFGATAKHVEARGRCSGLCTNLPTGGASSDGVDLGGQLRLTSIPLTIGAAVRNLGIGTSDNSPARVDVGASYRIAAVERLTQQEMQLYTAAGVVSTEKLDSASIRLGADLVFEKKIHVRGGYIYDRSTGSGTSIGFGVVTGHLAFDLARSYGNVLASDSNQPPTYFSLRYLW